MGKLTMESVLSSDVGTRQLKAQAQYDFLKNKYGDDPKMLRDAAAITMIGGELIEGFSKYNNAQLQMESISRRQAEIKGRSEIAIANILRQGKKVEAAQTTAFAKAGVKMEGSALNVLAETAETAGEAARVKQREADFELRQQAMLKETLKVKKKFAVIDTLLGVGGSVAMAKMK